MSSTAQRAIAEITALIDALPEEEREEVIISVSSLRAAKMIPQDFIEALDDFEHGRFVPMETALNDAAPNS